VNEPSKTSSSAMLRVLRACALVRACAAFPATGLSPGLSSRRAFAKKAAAGVAVGWQSRLFFPFGASAEETDGLTVASTAWKTSDNIFARIMRGEAPALVLEDGEELFSFEDIHPASTLHYLVIPRRFVRDASTLAPSDAALVREMEAKARTLVRRQVGDAFDERELLLGFHWPPWYSVPWLHMHAIYPRSDLTRRYKYTPFSFYSPERVLQRLERLGGRASRR